MKPQVTLTPKEIERCERYGRDVVESYKRGENPNSLAVSGERGAQFDVPKQARARMAEWAVCKYLDVYPGDLNWTMKPDPGFDILFAKKLRIDVKHTRHPHGKFLVWPLEIRHIFEAKKFDVLFFVRGLPPTFTMGGFIQKWAFWELHQVAPDGHDLEKDTWHMPEADLHHPEKFRRSYEYCFGHFVHRCHCGEPGPFGFGVNLRSGNEGRWYCREHRP